MLIDLGNLEIHGIQKVHMVYVFCMLDWLCWPLPLGYWTGGEGFGKGGS